MAHLIAAYQLATSTSALWTETAQPQAGDQNTTIMSDDKSTISGCVKDTYHVTYAANEQAAISTIGSFGNATKQVPAVVSVVPSTNTSTADKRAAAATARELVTVTTFSNVQPNSEDKARPRGICLQRQSWERHLTF